MPLVSHLPWRISRRGPDHRAALGGPMGWGWPQATDAVCFGDALLAQCVWNSCEQPSYRFPDLQLMRRRGGTLADETADGREARGGAGCHVLIGMRV